MQYYRNRETQLENTYSWFTGHQVLCGGLHTQSAEVLLLLKNSSINVLDKHTVQIFSGQSIQNGKWDYDFNMQDTYSTYTFYNN